jgi:hypothetical protein
VPPATVPAATLVVVAGGLVLIAVGTFLPWLRTGLATRNSFRAAGLIRRLLDPPGVTGVLLAGWPAIVTLCAVALALLAAGVRRGGLVVAAVVAGTAGAVAETTLVLPARSYAAAATSGPAVTTAGAALVLAALLIEVGRRSVARRARSAQSAPGMR